MYPPGNARVFEGDCWLLLDSNSSKAVNSSWFKSKSVIWALFFSRFERMTTGDVSFCACFRAVRMASGFVSTDTRKLLAKSNAVSTRRSNPFRPSATPRISINTARLEASPKEVTEDRGLVAPERNSFFPRITMGRK